MSFLSVRRGTGQFYESSAQLILSDMGADVHLGCAVEVIISSGNLVTAVVLRHADGQFERLPSISYYSAPRLPISCKWFFRLLRPTCSTHVGDCVTVTIYVLTCQQLVPRFPTTGSLHPFVRPAKARVSNYRDFSPRMAASATCSPLTVEYFCFEQDDLWQMPDEN